MIDSSIDLDLFEFHENNGRGRELGQASRSYEGYTEPVQLMSELARDEIRLDRVWVIAR